MLRRMLKLDSYLGWKVDFATPRGAPALLAPDSMHWRVFKNPVALGVGGVAAVLLEFADPRIRTGVWAHSTYKTDPVGRSMRTGMAAMVGVYGPEIAARRVIQAVTNMHARVQGETPDGVSYRALDPELLDWVAATATFGFLTAYDRFVAPLTQVEKTRFYDEAQHGARLYGAQHSPASDQDFMAQLLALAPGFESHPIVGEFLQIFSSSAGPLGTPRSLRRAMARAAVSILPPIVRERLDLGRAYTLGPASAAMLRSLGALAERLPIRDAPPAQASLRLGLPADFLYRSRAGQARALATWRARTGLAEPPTCR